MRCCWLLILFCGLPFIGKDPDIKTMEALVIKDYINFIEWPTKPSSDTIRARIYDPEVYFKLDSMLKKNLYRRPLILLKGSDRILYKDVDLVFIPLNIMLDSIIELEIRKQTNCLVIVQRKSWYSSQNPRLKRNVFLISKRGFSPSLTNSYLSENGYILNKDKFEFDPYSIGMLRRHRITHVWKRQLKFVLDTSYMTHGHTKRYNVTSGANDGKKLVPVKRKTENVQPLPNTVFYDDGRTGDIEAGNLFGINYSYYPNGNVKYSTPYKEGKKDGFYQAYYESGIIRESGFLFRSHKVGQQVRNYYNGSARLKQTFNNDGLKTGHQINYYKNGLIKKLAVYKDNLREGYTIEYDSTGKLAIAMYYEQDELTESLSDTMLLKSLLDYVKGENLVIHTQKNLREKEKQSTIALVKQSTDKEKVEQQRRLDSLQMAQNNLIIDQLEKDKLITNLQAKEYREQLIISQREKQLQSLENEKKAIEIENIKSTPELKLN